MPLLRWRASLIHHAPPVADQALAHAVAVLNTMQLFLDCAVVPDNIIVVLGSIVERLKFAVSREAVFRNCYPVPISCFETT